MSRVNELLQAQGYDVRVVGKSGVVQSGDYGFTALMHKLDEMDRRLFAIERQLERLDVHYAALYKYAMDTRRPLPKAAI